MTVNRMKAANHKIAELLSVRSVDKIKSFAVLIDPDKVNFDTFPAFLKSAEQHGVDFFFVGGSLITDYSIRELVAADRKSVV